MQIMEDYWALHQIPELGSELPLTASYIRSKLEPLCCQVFSPTAGTVCAFFDFGMANTVAFRADCDALPVEEQTNLSYQSAHPGKMHACGHDGHTAILLELARRLQKNEKYNVLLIFQPAEETTGGAKQICDTGILEQYQVWAIFALHLWPGLPKGVIYSRPGVLMSGSAEVRAEFTGKAAHIAGTIRGGDALQACCRFYERARKLPCFMKFGKLTAGIAGNIVCPKAVLEGSLRTKSEKSRKKYTAQLKKLCRKVSVSAGCQGTIRVSQGYPAVCNDRKLCKKMMKTGLVRRLPGAFWTAEDFSYYQQKVPGVYFLLGLGDTPPLHSPMFSFDEKVLIKGPDFFQTLLQKL